MRKKDLISIKPKEPSADLISKAVKDKRCARSYETEIYVNDYRGGWTRQRVRRKEKSYGTRLFLTARKENGILVIGVFTKGSLKKGNSEPYFVTYIETESGKWLSLVKGGKWTEALFANIILSHEQSLASGTNWQIAKDVYDEEDLKLVEEELGTKAGDIEDSIHDFQRKSRDDENVRRAKKRAAYWERQMSKIPAEPSDFDDWIQHEATRKSNFIFYRRKGKKTEAYCTHCEYRWTTAEKMVHNPGYPDVYGHKVEHSAFCPNCHTILETKAWGRQEALRTEDRVTLMLPAQEYTAFRGYEVNKLFRNYKRYDGRDEWKCLTTVKEDLRVLANRVSFQPIESYTMREEKTLGKVMWAETKEGTYSGGTRPITMFRGIPYMKNMETILEGSWVRPEVLKLFTSGGDEHIQNALITAAKKRYVEYIIKAGLTHLARQVINFDMQNVIVNENANNLKDLLGIDGQQLHILKTVNGTGNCIKALRYAKEHGEKLPTETLKTIADLSIAPEHLDLERTGMTLQRMVNYIVRQSGEMGLSFGETSRLYSDYLDMAWAMGADLKDEIICHTSKLRQMHDRYVELKNRDKDKFAAQLADRKFPQISERYKENAEHFKYSKAGLTIVVPKCASDIQEEGRRQHHCVGANDRYISQMNDGESYILFLRKEESKEEAYYTLEVEYDGKVRQSYGAYDRKPDWDKVEPVLTAFTKQIGKRTEREKRKQAAAEVLYQAG